MGTSSDFAGGRGGAWTGYKRAASSFARHGGQARAGRVLARHVGTLGGAGGAAASSAAGRQTAQRLGGVLSGIATGGLAQTLDEYGLRDLVGKDRYDVLDGLIEAIAGDGNDLEAQAARSAALDVLDEMLPDGESFEDINGVQLDAAAVRDLFAKFLAAYVYNRAAPVIEERLNRLGDPSQAEARDREIRDYAKSLIDVRLSELDPLSVDWNGPQGTAVVDQVINDVYALIEALDE